MWIRFNWFPNPSVIASKPAKWLWRTRVDPTWEPQHLETIITPKIPTDVKSCIKTSLFAPFQWFPLKKVSFSLSYILQGSGANLRLGPDEIFDTSWTMFPSIKGHWAIFSTGKQGYSSSRLFSCLRIWGYCGLAKQRSSWAGKIRIRALIYECRRIPHCGCFFSLTSDLLESNRHIEWVFVFHKDETFSFAHLWATSIFECET